MLSFTIASPEMSRMSAGTVCKVGERREIVSPGTRSEDNFVCPVRIEASVFGPLVSRKQGGRHTFTIDLDAYIAPKPTHLSHLCDCLFRFDQSRHDRQT
ncbi:hypothetical protein AG1IA_08255 [Rhizoctonia solani AG-1 IA]|uniref:Uncharacterized protein n=1 Tax=Thanatephorus cucumeris (strain AG1-IA) TaxID=983506 RepID=L8WLL6_THACA|nr:hypothetical protein AG1IA_08255 [Rhizoctonia solani AG-1 IA]